MIEYRKGDTVTKPNGDKFILDTDEKVDTYNKGTMTEKWYREIRFKPIDFSKLR